MKTAVSIAELKTLVKAKIQKESLSYSLINQGLPIGAITQISGYGKTELAVKFISEHPKAKVAWIEENFSIFPLAFLQRKVKLDRLLFVEAQSDVAWSVLQALKAQIFPIIVIYAENIELQTLRRIQLASEKAGAVTIWLTNQSKTLYPVYLHLESAKTQNINVLKRRL